MLKQSEERLFIFGFLAILTELLQIAHLRRIGKKSGIAKSKSEAWTWWKTETFKEQGASSNLSDMLDLCHFSDCSIQDARPIISARLGSCSKVVSVGKKWSNIWICFMSIGRVLTTLMSNNSAISSSFRQAITAHAPPDFAKNENYFSALQTMKNCKYANQGKSLFNSKRR